MTNNNWFVCILCYCKSNIDTGKIPSKKKYVAFNETNKVLKCLLFSLNIVCSFLFIKQIILHLKCSVSSTVTKCSVSLHPKLHNIAKFL